MASGTLELLAQELSRALQPLEERLRSAEVRELFADLGLEFPPALEAQGAFVGALGTAANAATSLGPLGVQLKSAIDADDLPGMVKVAAQIVDTMRTLIPALDTIGTELQGLSGAFPGINPADVAAFAAQLPGRLLEYILVRYLEGYYPAVLRLLTLVGLVEVAHVAGDATNAAKPPHTRRQIHLARLGELLSSPEDLLRSLYGWGNPTFDGRLLLEQLQELLLSLSVPASFEPEATPPALHLFFARVSPRTDLNPPGLEAVLEVSFPGELTISFPILQPHWALELQIGAQLDSQTGILFQPPANISIIPPSGSVQGEVSVAVVRGPSAGTPSIVLVGIAGGSGLQAQQIRFGFGAGFRWDSSSSRAKGDFGFSGEIKGGKLIVTLEGADGFIGNVLSGFGIEADFNLGFGWRAGSGFYFTGSSVLEIQLPLHIALGPVEFSALTLTVGIQDSVFPIGLAVDIKAMLGPLQAVVQQVGIGAELGFPADHKGNAGPLDFDLNFKPPKGVGLSIDVGVVKGGGYLFIDPDRGEYAGAIELALFNVVTIKAIGIISTKMPDGSKGFSLLIIMSVEFGTGIQLGFGFTLLAVGGLLGLHRTMQLQVLADGIRSGAVESVMFPKDIIANAPKIISDLKAFFPPYEGKFLIGPMAKLGWGTPTLVSLSLGIIIEIPGNIAIVGILQIALPTPDASVIKLQVNFIGAIEFDKKRIWFFAALFDSRVVFLTIEGEMGLLVAFGDDANFVVSVGGFHPRFSPPPLPFPSPRRIAISLLNTSVARVRIEGYFAVTSNTVQFGARVELFFGFSVLNVKGHLGFDALFQFSPFFFAIEISASLSVNVFGAGLFSVSIRGSLEGPAPWHVLGHGSISILFWDIDVDFEKTWGEDRKEELPPIPVLPILQTELDKAENWRALLPTGTSHFVSLRKMPEAEAALILHPVGVLRISQRAVPLELKLDKVGTQKPSDVNRLSLSVVPGGLAKKGDAYEQFAPAQYQNFSDSAKLSKPAFAPERAGVELSASGADLRSFNMARRAVRYEEIIIDSNYKRFQRRFRGFIGVLFNFFLNGAAVTRCEVSKASQKKLQPFEEKIEVNAETYTVAFQANNEAVSSEAVSFHSEASARDYLDRQIAADPSLVDQMHVIPSFERAA